MQELQALQPHFACVIRRMAKNQETRLVDSSLRHFMSSLPTATLILDWNLKVMHYNSIASHLCSQWKRGALRRSSRLPGGFRCRATFWRSSSACVRASWPKMGSKPGRPKTVAFSIIAIPPFHGWVPLLSFCLPVRSPSPKELFSLLSRKSMLRIEDGLVHKINQLTRRERECALLAAQGLHNRDIAKQAGKERDYRTKPVEFDL